MIYQMPAEFGSDWAWADFGVIRDGFRSREAAEADWQYQKKIHEIAYASEEVDCENKKLVCPTCQTSVICGTSEASCLVCGTSWRTDEEPKVQ